MADVNPDEIARLLNESAAAHRAAQEAKTRKRNISEWARHINRAYELRSEAHELDPEHTAPSWSEGKASHESLMTFYEGIRARA